MQVSGAVDEAVAMMRDVADRGVVDDAARDRLELIDGRIRAGIQVDPELSGSFALLARSLVEMAAADGLAVDVRSLGPVHDRRPVPSEMEGLLRRLLLASHPARPSIQAFSDGDYDYLALSVGGGDIRLRALRDSQDITLELLDDEDDEGRRTVLAKRPVTNASDAKGSPETLTVSAATG